MGPVLPNRLGRSLALPSAAGPRDIPMPPRSFVSVIIPVRNSPDTLPDCLLALERQSVPSDQYEVIVVDDGSTDDTATVASECGAQVISIAQCGPGAARNRGVEVAKGDLILFTDADCAPDAEWIRSMTEPFDDAEVAATKGVYRTEQTSWTARLVQAEYESRYRLMQSRDSIDFIDTYSAGYRCSVFEDAGGFDESFPVPCVEDQELGFRLAKMGCRMVFCPRAVVAHRHASDPVSYFRKKVKIAYWKMKVLVRYPDKAISDSHTPSSLKAEIVLTALTIASLPVAAVASIWWLPLVFFGSFLATCAPFCGVLLFGSPALAISAPLFLTLRSVALGVGMVLGILGRPMRSGGREKRMQQATEASQRIEEHA